MNLLRTIYAGAAALALISASSAAWAQDAAYPTRPVKMVVAWSPGGATDLLARQVAVELAKHLGQSVIVDNKPGAGGTIGHAQVAKSAPDGYTLVLATNSTYAIAEHLYKSLPYKHERDLTPVSQLAASPLILAARNGLEVKNAGDLVAMARNQPGKINIASGGAGSTSHLASEMFMALTGTTMTHVPYKGGGPANTALVTGEVDVAFLDLGVAIPFMSSNKIKGIGSSGAKRSPLLPNVPTIGESGVPRFESTTTFALFAPAGTPRPIVDKLAGAVRLSMAEPELRAKLLRQGIEIVASTPDELGKSAAAESARWGKIIQERNISIE